MQTKQKEQPKTEMELYVLEVLTAKHKNDMLALYNARTDEVRRERTAVVTTYTTNLVLWVFSGALFVGGVWLITFGLKHLFKLWGLL